jgi:hypothetical protein
MRTSVPAQPPGAPERGEPAQSGAQAGSGRSSGGGEAHGHFAQASHLALARVDAPGLPVEEGDLGDVGADERSGPVHDRLEDDLQIEV